jgi:hypothetical protein
MDGTRGHGGILDDDEFLLQDYFLLLDDEFLLGWIRQQRGGLGSASPARGKGRSTLRQKFFRLHRLLIVLGLGHVLNLLFGVRLVLVVIVLDFDSFVIHTVCLTRLSRGVESLVDRCSKTMLDDLVSAGRSSKVVVAACRPIDVTKPGSDICLGELARLPNMSSREHDEFGMRD